MNGHLSSEQISRWAMGERGAAEAEHVGACAECGAKVARIETVLAHFGSAVRDWSSGWASGQEALLLRGATREPARWLLAAAAIVTLVLVPVYWDARQRKRAEEVAADAVLMERVDRAVSRTVPETMEPLIELVSYEPGIAEKSEEKR
ncbi:MAG TPA: hypothetical protein VMH81_18270 [Bryobacteraceae bacterium]|nr:hypothetical protein [Bryobacteraceae bacterium]